jgi:hypothetical protein
MGGRPGLVLAAVVAGIATTAPGSVLAGSELPHEGPYGVHSLIDRSESGGAICEYSESGDIVRVSARRPVVYARDMSGGVDSQVVGRRVAFEATNSNPILGPWETISTTSLRTATATDRRMAALPKANLDVSTTALQWYRIRVIMTWLRGGTTVATAAHRPYYHDLVASGVKVATYGSYCPGTYTSVVAHPTSVAPRGAAPVDGDHSGTTGVHTPFDTREYPGMTCTWDATGTDLQKIVIRRPIAFPAGSGDQVVRYRYAIEYADDDPFLQTSYTILAWGPWRSAVASGNVSAVFPVETYLVPNAADGHTYYRVRVHLRWMTDSVATGRATHWVHYARRKGVSPDIQDYSYCAPPA